MPSTSRSSSPAPNSLTPAAPITLGIIRNFVADCTASRPRSLRPTRTSFRRRASPCARCDSACDPGRRCCCCGSATSRCRLPLLHNVVKETLRLHSPTPLVTSKAQTEMSVPETSCVVAAAHTLLSALNFLGRTEEDFPGRSSGNHVDGMRRQVLVTVTRTTTKGNVLSASLSGANRLGASRDLTDSVYRNNLCLLCRSDHDNEN